MSKVIDNIEDINAIDAKAPLASPALTGTPTAPTAAAGTNTTQVATTAFVSSAMSGGIPSGVITLWSGSSASIPSGWYLCNGANGTPNLMDRFVVGAGSGYAVGATGGSTSASISGTTGATTLTTTQMPSHNHTFNTHGITGGQNYAGGYMPRGVSPYGATATYNTGTNSSGGNGSHTHEMSGSVDTRSPYYALCYIMKA